ncbi:MAG: hypothetical protein RIK87_30665 [Fuerstiella sp.]
MFGPSAALPLAGILLTCLLAGCSSETAPAEDSSDIRIQVDQDLVDIEEQTQREYAAKYAEL